jgi:hypothetical protein
MFGSDGLLHQPPDIRTAITHRVEPLHINTKCIFQTRNIESHQIGIHTIDGNQDQADGSITFRLNHYPIQSLEYFQKVKMGRGDVNSPSTDGIRDMDYFRRYDKDATFADTDLRDMVLLQQQQQQPGHTWCTVLFVLFFLLVASLLFFLPKTFKKKNHKR